MKRKLKKAASLLLCFAMQFGTLATAAQAAYADSTAQTDIPPASDAANAQIEVTADKVTNGAQSFWASASVNGFNVRLNVTANGLQNADFRAAVMDADTYVRELRANPASMTYEQFEQPESAGITTTAHYLYKTGVKLGADNAAVTVPMGSLKPLALNNETAVTAGDQKTKYYRSYVYLIAVQQMGTAKENYFVGRFLIDNEGNLLEPTYLVRYLQNQQANDTKAAVTGTVDPNLTAQGSGTTLRGNGFTRKGYTFKGWDTNADFWKRWRAGEQGDDKYRYTEGDAPAYQPGNTLSYASSYAYDIVDLYAQWFPQVPEFHAETQTLPTSDTQKLKVNVAYTQQYELLTGDKGTTSTDTKKQYSVTSVQKLPAGLKVEPVNGSTTKWQITGTPTAQTDEETVVTIRVTDATNQTFDEIKVTIPKIEKGDQALLPDLDVMTGLQSNVLTETGDEGTEIKDGLLLGFYAEGQRDSNANGTGTLTDFYLNKVGNEALVYEYRPKPAEGAEQADWREVPLPEAYYKSLTEDERAALAASMETGAETRVKSSLPHGTEDAAVTAETGQTAWPENYGSISFEGGLPVIHGLTENAKYEVRFKANADYGASAAVTLPITAGGGGAVIGGGAGPTLRVSLAGGVAPTDDEATADVDEGAQWLAWLKECGALASGGTVKVTDLKPTRTGYSLEYWLLSWHDAETGEVQSESRKAGDEIALGSDALTLTPVWKAEAGGFVSLTFYDWDESLLGATVISKNATAADVQAAIEAFTASKYHGFVTETEAAQDETLTATRLPADLSTDAYHADAAYPLTDKDGYHFTGWMQVTDDRPIDTFTSIHDEDRDAALGTAQGMLFDPAAHEADAAWDTMQLKAVYTGNTKLQISGAAKYYSITDFDGNMYGNSTNATTGTPSVTVTVKRSNASGQPVARLRQPVIQARYTVNGADAYMQVRLDNMDTAQAELVIPKGAEIARIIVVDVWGTNIYSASFVSDTTALNNQTMSGGGSAENSFVVMASLGSVSKRARAQNENIKNSTTSAEWTSGIGAYVLKTELGISYASLAPDRHKILLAVYAMGEHDLSLEELQQAIDMTFTNVTLPTANSGAAVYTAMATLYGYIDQAIALNGGNPLTSIAQVHAALESHGTAIN